ncbi:nucleotidyltransferase domain-containing protein [Candidatus Pacearchaeota archaeon]|nr:nucleotidyltransferase domain-containing protein [Candidatus Pacearchaeota archaeon]
MKTIMRHGILKILELFYEMKREKAGIHLREIARRTKLNENSASRFLNQLEEEGILVSKKEGNMKKYSYKKSSSTYIIFSMFDDKKYQNLPAIRKEAMNKFFSKLKEQPITALLFGSTAGGGYRKDSDIDLLLVVNKKIKTDEAAEYAESQTGIRIQAIQLTAEELIMESRLFKDPLISSAIKTGFPILNHAKYYEMTENED